MKKKNWITILVTIAGILSGYIYYLEIGCNSGSCPITSNPYFSMLWGGLIGYLVADMINNRKKKQASENTDKPEL